MMNSKQLEEKYRNQYETDREWKLKEQFIEAYKDEYDEDRLICLAQCYANIETMGCRYPNELMKEIKSLTQDFKPLVEERSTTSSDPTLHPHSKFEKKNTGYTLIQFVPSSTNPKKDVNTTNSTSTAKSNITILKSNKPKQQSPTTTTVTKQQPQQQQIQILKKPTVSQESATKQSQSVSQTKAMSPPKNNLSNTNHHSSNTNKPSPGYSNNNNSNGGQKNAWNSPNQRTRLDFNGSSNSGGSNSNQNKKESAYKIYNQTPQNIGTGTGVPSSTMEQSPAPHHLPIPFGLSTPTFEDSAIITSNSLPFETSKPKSLLNTLFPSTEVKPSIQQQLDFSSDKTNKEQSKPDPLRALIQGLAKQQTAQPQQDSQFQKLNKISKLREILRSDVQITGYIESRSQSFKSLGNQQQPNKEQDIIEHFKKICQSNDIKLNYVQFLMPEGFYGEIYLENFRLIKEQDKKRKRCCYFAHRNALLLLHGNRELAVRIAPQLKRDKNITLDNHNENVNNEIEFEYELYLVDSADFTEANIYSSLPPQSAISNGKSLHNIFNTSVQESSKPSFEYSRQTSLPAELTPTQLNPATDKESIFHLNTMLKSLILPQQQQQQQASSLGHNESQNILEEDDEDEMDMTLSVDRKTRLRESIGSSFCLFIPESMLNTATGEIDSITDRNAISILNNSCQKCGFTLEFELKLKSSSNKQVISAYQIESDSEEGDSENDNVKRKYKSKCLVNKVKVASSHAKTKIDSKRQAALKSLNYLTKIFPIIKETSYTAPSIPTSTSSNFYSPHGDFHNPDAATQSLPVQSTTAAAAAAAQQPRYFKISKDDLFKGLVPPTLFETSSQSATSAALTTGKSQIGTANCL